jgi:NIMA-interacting peptidyl-prolyl cis-trans isomerase 1
LHILKKHKGSRRPSSWRIANITQSKEEAISQIQAIRDQVVAAKNDEELFSLFADIAKRESDCGSAERGGDLGFFGRGKLKLAISRYA